VHSLVNREREQQTWYEDERLQFKNINGDSDSSEYESASEIIDTTEKSPIIVTECSQLLIVLNDTIGSLLKLSILIYKSDRRTKFSRSSREKHYDTRFDISYVEEAFSYAFKNRPLIEKLGKANAQRRQWLAYRKRHHEKLSSSSEATHRRLGDLRSQSQTDLHSHAGEASLFTSTIPVSSHLPLPSTGYEETEATTFYDESHFSRHRDHNQDEPSETSYSVSSSSEIDKQREFVPRPPPESADGKPFECPFCFTILTIDNLNAWV
jgi:hypothetical protein